MSGYLRRMIAGIRTPVSRIRPLVGSVFEPSQVGVGADLLAPEDEVPAAPRSVSPPASSIENEYSVVRGRTASAIENASEVPVQRTMEPSTPLPSVLTVSLPRVDQTTASPNFQTRTPVEEVGSRFRPLTPVVSETATTVGNKPTLPPAPVPELAGFPDSAVQSTTGTDRDQETAVLKQQLLPMPSPIANSERVRNAQDLQPKGSESARKTDARDRRLAAPTKEPDEIQIHIGRIEVVAAPPPIARPSPVSNRKSIDLGDYLKRRNGSAR